MGLSVVVVVILAIIAVKILIKSVKIFFTVIAFGGLLLILSAGGVSFLNNVFGTNINILDSVKSFFCAAFGL